MWIWKVQYGTIEANDVLPLRWGLSVIFAPMVYVHVRSVGFWNKFGRTPKPRYRSEQRCLLSSLVKDQRLTITLTAEAEPRYCLLPVQ